MKEKKMISKVKWVLGLTIAACALTGCESNETLEESVNARWQGIVENEYEKAYQYYSPGYKEIESLDGFKVRMSTAKLNMEWHKGTYQSETCATEDACEVSVEVVYSYKFSKRSLGGVENIPTKLKENWIKVDGKWFHVPKNK